MQQRGDVSRHRASSSVAAQIAGSALLLRVGAVFVMCGHVRGWCEAGRCAAGRSFSRDASRQGPWVPAAEQRTSLTPSSMILVWPVWCFYALQLVDEFSDASGDVLVECAASNRREDA